MLGVLCLAFTFFVLPWLATYGEPSVNKFPENNTDIPVVSISGIFDYVSLSTRHPYKSYLLITPEAKYALNCSAPHYMECFPAAHHYKATSLSVEAFQLGPQQLLLKKIYTSDGVLLANEEFFKQRITTIAKTPQTTQKVFAIMGILAMLIYGRVLFKYQTNIRNDHHY